MNKTTITIARTVLALRKLNGATKGESKQLIQYLRFIAKESAA